MKKEDIFNIIGEAAPEKVAEAANEIPHTKNSVWMKRSVLAACFCLAVAGVYGIQNIQSSWDGELQKESVLEQQGSDEKESENIVNPQTENVPDIGGEQEMMNIEDHPADQNSIYHENSTGDLSSVMEEIYGGSFVDEKGQLIAVLIEDTPQNRSIVCKELGVKENQISFQTGTYTLQYLTELQEKISDGMSKKEFSFINSSYVNEISNRITISVTTNEEEQLKKVLALDTMGGAIEIEFSQDEMKEYME